jgi:hypothetical protein
VSCRALIEDRVLEPKCMAEITIEGAGTRRAGLREGSELGSAGMSRFSFPALEAYAATMSARRRPAQKHRHYNGRVQLETLRHSNRW